MRRGNACCGSREGGESGNEKSEKCVSTKIGARASKGAGGAHMSDDPVHFPLFPGSVSVAWKMTARVHGTELGIRVPPRTPSPRPRLIRSV